MNTINDDDKSDLRPINVIDFEPDANERETERNQQRTSFLNKLITSKTDEPLKEKSKHKKHNSLAKGSKRMMSKLMKLNTKSTSVFKKEDEQSNLEDKTHQQKEIRELLKSETMITRNIKTLNKEKKINDTIVAVMSFMSIIICICQVYILSNYSYTI